MAKVLLLLIFQRHPWVGLGPLNQFRTFRWNLTASAARPNPQGSFRYGSINITRTIKLVNSFGNVDGKLRYAINGVSHVETETPLKSLRNTSRSLRRCSTSSQGNGLQKKRTNYNLLDAVSRHTIQVFPKSWGGHSSDIRQLWNVELEV
ncbi:L-ascorbate oxidase-like protein, partial [Cucurbita argyrosperma subsp. sororia]